MTKGLRPVVLEVRRRGRRPRYHQAARTEQGLLQPEQCNLDQVGLEVVELRRLPEYPVVRRPWSQLCRRCYRGTALLAAADQLRLELANARALKEALA